jgi:putative flavoprotein involved in K+ transport
MRKLDSVVVGAGQAGLGVSYFLQMDGRKHLVFERGRVGESWRSQRWDSFKLNTPNSMNALPGLPYDGPEPDGFWRSEELVDYFQRYVDTFQLPVRTGVKVLSVERDKDDQGFIVKTSTDGQANDLVRSRSIVIASGIQHTPNYPPAHSRMPPDITQLHSSAYRNAARLQPGAVVVVGSAQSGVQIAEDLLSAGRRVYLCTGKVGRVPRRYRGRDVTGWMVDMKQFDVPYSSLEDKSAIRAGSLQVSGLGRHGHTLSLQNLARQGAVVLGRLLDVEESVLLLSDEAAINVRFADQFSQQKKEEIDLFLAQAGIIPPPLEEDPADLPDPHAECVSPLRRLDLREAQVSTIIWASGFRGDFSWIHLPVIDAGGQPVHQRGISPVRGLYFLGFPWLISSKSGILYGVADDAHAIAGVISEQLT